MPVWNRELPRDLELGGSSGRRPNPGVSPISPPAAGLTTARYTHICTLIPIFTFHVRVVLQITTEGVANVFSFQEKKKGKMYSSSSSMQLGISSLLLKGRHKRRTERSDKFRVFKHADGLPL